MYSNTLCSGTCRHTAFVSALAAAKLVCCLRQKTLQESGRHLKGQLPMAGKTHHASYLMSFSEMSLCATSVVTPNCAIGTSIAVDIHGQASMRGHGKPSKLPKMAVQCDLIYIYIYYRLVNGKWDTTCDNEPMLSVQLHHTEFRSPTARTLFLGLDLWCANAQPRAP